MFLMTILGEPVAKERPRLSKCGRVYTPKKTRQWEAMASQAMCLQWGKRPLLASAVLVKIWAIYPRPKKRPRTVTREAWESGMRIWRPSRPDLDNVIKCALDAAQLAGVLKDDGFVVHINARKLYAGDPEVVYNDSPKVIIGFEEVW